VSRYRRRWPGGGRTLAIAPCDTQRARSGRGAAAWGTVERANRLRERQEVRFPSQRPRRPPPLREPPPPDPERERLEPEPRDREPAPDERERAPERACARDSEPPRDPPRELALGREYDRLPRCERARSGEPAPRLDRVSNAGRARSLTRPRDDEDGLRDPVAVRWRDDEDGLRDSVAVRRRDDGDGRLDSVDARRRKSDARSCASERLSAARLSLASGRRPRPRRSASRRQSLAGTFCVVRSS
jgi:hypothetical protein